MVFDSVLEEGKILYLLEPGYIQTASRVMLTLKKGANSEDSRKLSTESAAQ
jgi:hypothetical protein